MALTNLQYDEIMRSYEQLQNQSRQELQRREQEVYAEIPELAKLDAEIAHAGTACVRAMLEASTENSTQGAGAYSMQFQREQKQITKRRESLLLEHGYPRNYLSPSYHCPDCRDTGYIGTKKCHCFQQAIVDLLYAQSNLRELLRDTRFSDFDLSYYSDKIRDTATGLSAQQLAERTLRECRQFVNQFDLQFENLFLYGSTGLGKTFLSQCIAKELLETAHSVVYFSAFRLFELFADAAFGRKEAGNGAKESELERHIFDCDFLIIDDLGTELTNTFVSSQLFLILNERMLRRKSTLISTNLSLETVAGTYSERVFSRISSNYRMLKLVGQDIRLQKRMRSR